MPGYVALFDRGLTMVGMVQHEPKLAASLANNLMIIAAADQTLHAAAKSHPIIPSPSSPAVHTSGPRRHLQLDRATANRRENDATRACNISRTMIRLTPDSSAQPTSPYAHPRISDRN
jgi:hypothetical protein